MQIIIIIIIGKGKEEEREMEGERLRKRGRRSEIAEPASWRYEATPFLRTASPLVKRISQEI